MLSKIASTCEWFLGHDSPTRIVAKATVLQTPVEGPSRVLATYPKAIGGLQKGKRVSKLLTILVVDAYAAWAGECFERCLNLETPF